MKHKCNIDTSDNISVITLLDYIASSKPLDCSLRRASVRFLQFRLLQFHLNRGFSSITLWRHPSTFRELSPGLLSQAFTHFVLSAKPTEEWFVKLSFCLFWGFHFLPKNVFYLALRPNILTHLWLRWKHDYPIQDFSLCLLSKSYAFQLAHEFELKYPDLSGVTKYSQKTDLLNLSLTRWC